METEMRYSGNDVLGQSQVGGSSCGRNSGRGTWIYPPSTGSDRMEVEFVSYATIRDAIGTKSVTLALDDGATVEEALSALAGEYDGLESLLFTSGGELRPHVNVLVDDENVRTLDGRTTELQAGATVALAPGVAGGLGTEGDA